MENPLGGVDASDIIDIDQYQARSRGHLSSRKIRENATVKTYLGIWNFEILPFEIVDLKEVRPSNFV